MRDAVAEVFPQLEEVDGERPKRWRLPNGLSGIFREPLAEELAALRGIARRLAREGGQESAALLDSVASKIEASLKPARRRTLRPMSTRCLRPRASRRGRDRGRLSRRKASR